MKYLLDESGSTKQYINMNNAIINAREISVSGTTLRLGKYNHEDTYLIMARTRNKSLQLEVDDRGLKIYAELIDTQSNRDVYKSIRAGLLDKMSFAFIVSEANWDTVDGQDVRRIKGIEKLFDVSVVDVPAYDQTEVYARSKEVAEKEQEAYHKLQLEKEKLLLLLEV